MSDLRRDQYGRLLCPDNVVPREPFAIWRGKVTHPDAVRTPHRDDHDRECFHGWIPSGEWWLICGICASRLVDGPPQP